MTHYSDQALTALRERYPEIDDCTVVIDRLRFGKLRMALEDAFPKAHPAAVEALRDHLNDLPDEDWRFLNSFYETGAAFSLPFGADEPGKHKVRLFSPFPMLPPMFEPESSNAHMLPWHGDMEHGREDVEQRFRRFVVWHETGHVVSDVNSHDAVFEPPYDPKDPPPEPLRQLASRNASEMYSDAFGLRNIGAQDPETAFDTAVDVSDWRVINMVSAHMAHGEDSTIYCTAPAINDAIRDIARYVKPGDELRDPGGAAIAKATRDSVERVRHNPADLAEADALLDSLRGPMQVSSQHFIRSMGMQALAADGPAAYYLARNYLDALSRRLPEDHRLHPAIDDARKLTSMNKQADQWDRECPPIEAAVTAARLHIQRMAKLPPEPAPAAAPAPGKRR
jgi:hypothetical protein